MATWLQEYRLGQRRLKEKTQGRQGAPYLAVISASNPQSETVTVEGPTGRQVTVIHPFLSANSWIRAMPESGSGVMMAQRYDSEESEIVRYLQPNLGDRVDAYEKGLELYRQLQPGEIEVSSRGIAQTYYSRKPVKEDRAGVVRSWLDGVKLESGTRSPTHRRSLHTQEDGGILDEERFGVVKRWLPGSRIEEQYVMAVSPPSYGREYLRVLGTGVPGAIDRYEDLRIGTVVDDVGNPILLGASGQALRYQHLLKTPTGQNYSVQIDESGNFELKLPAEATVGGNVSMSTSPFKMSCKEMQIDAVDAFRFSSGKSVDWLTQTWKNQVNTFDLQAATTMNYQAGASVAWKTPLFTIGSAPIEPAVLGTQFMAFMNALITALVAHQHLTTVPTFPTLPDPATTVAPLEALRASFLATSLVISNYIMFSKVP